MLDLIVVRGFTSIVNLERNINQGDSARSEKGDKYNIHDLLSDFLSRARERNLDSRRHEGSQLSQVAYRERLSVSTNEVTSGEKPD
ncbi:MAG: hypothetical protein HYV60_16440 [Planctomycetia bacterium]|nr:hypothetical protein [Planctomycetia bacterium]